MKAAATARVIHVAEYGECDVPINEVLIDGRIDVREEVTGQRYFDISMRKGTLRLTAGSCIGLIPLNDRVTINVRPRVPLRNFAHILAIAQGEATTLPFASRLFESSAESAQSVLDAMARGFVRGVSEILQQGRHASYISEHSSTSLPRGRIAIGPTLVRHLARGEETRVVASRFLRSTDTAPNRLIRYAIEFLVAKYQRLRGRRYREMRADLNVAARSFADVPLDFTRSFLSDPLIVTPTLMPASRHRYVPAIRLAKAIIHKRGLDLPTVDDLRLESLTFRMEDIFEDYVRNVLRTRALRSGRPLRVTSGEESRKLLFDAAPSEQATPDVVLTVAGNGLQLTAGVAEVKYIDRPPAREHINQLIAYGASFRVPHAFLIHPAVPDGARGLYKISAIAPTTYYWYAIDLAADLNDEEERLSATVLDRIIPGVVAAA